MGKEFFGKGSNVQLGPGVCLARVPRNGRNFEYISGEDPFLGNDRNLVRLLSCDKECPMVVVFFAHYMPLRCVAHRNV